MKRGTLCVLTAVVAGFTFAAYAELKDNPYQVIVDRNPFNLKPIPPPPPVVETAPTNTPPPVDIKLTGVTTLLGPPRAFLQLMNQQTKKPEYPPGLEAGERFGDIEIVAIDPKEGTVRIKQGAAETTLDFEKNGIKTAGAPGPGAVPVPGAPAGVPGLMPPPPAPGAGFTGAPGAPTQNGSRALVAGNMASTVPTPGVNPAVPNAGLPNRPLRSDFGNNVIVSGAGQPTTTPQPATAMPTLSRDDAEARIEAQRRMLEQREQSGGAPPGMSRILPPTRFSPPSPAPAVPRPGQ